MTRPTMTIEVDFVNDPSSATETWTDITKYVRTKGAEAALLNCSRGRNYELARTQAGTISLVLDNTDGRFDPANTQSPYVLGTANPGGVAGLVVSRRRVRIRATYSGTTYYVWRGYIEDWPQEWSDAGFYGTSNTAGSDAISVLARVDLDAFPVADILSDSPAALYRCIDDAAGASAGNVSATNQPLAVIKTGKSTAGATFAFGGTVGSGNLAADPTSSLTLTGAWNGAVNNAGYLLRTADLGVGPLLPPATWTVECWFLSSNSTQNVNAQLFLQTDNASQQQAQMYLSAVTGGYSVVAQLGSPIVVVSGTTNVTDGAWHHIAMTLASDGKTLKLYIDGVLQGTTVGASAQSWNPSYLNEWGGAVYPGYTTGTYFLSGSLKNLAIHTSTLSATRVLSHFSAGKSFTGDTSDARLGRVLDFAAWPTALRNLAAGDSTVGVQLADGVKALQTLEEVNATELGNLFIDSQGRVAFTGRHSRYNGTAVAAFGEQENPYAGLQMVQDPREIYNDVTVSRTGGVTVRDIDTASQDRFFPSGLTQATIAVDDAAVVYTAQYLTDRYRNPVTRIPQLVLDPQGDPSLWAQVLGREIGDRITVTRRPPNRTITADYFIESVAHAVTATTWKTTWLLSPASLDAYFELDSATYGRLGGSTTLHSSATSGATSITTDALTSSTTFSTTDTPYTVLVDAEEMTVTTAAAPSGSPLTQVLTVTRAANGTTAAAHSSSADVSLAHTYGLSL